MAHVEKFTRSQVQGVANHIERKTEHHSNKDIDVEKTHLNYSLLDDDLDLNQRLQNRLEEVSVLNRKDVNVMASWIVTLPQELKEAPQEEIEAFFEATHDFLVKRYGGLKNALASEVHMDETTPHLHFAFVPTVFDEKREKDRVNAKKVVSRSDLKAFHGDLDAYLKKSIPRVYERGVINGKTLGLDSVEQIKLHNDIIKQAKEATRGLETEFKTMQSFVDQVKKASEISEEIPSYAKITRKTFGRQEFVTVPIEKWKERTISLSEQKIIDDAIKIVEEETKRMKSTDYFKLGKEKHEENKDLKKEITRLEQELSEKNLEIEETRELSRIGKTMSQVFNVIKEPILNNFDRLHGLAEKIPYENLSDFCVAGLEATLTYQDEYRFSKILDIATDGWNHDLNRVRQGYGLYSSVAEYEKSLEIQTPQRDYSYEPEL